MNQKTEHEVATGTETWEGEVNNLAGADKIARAAIITSRSCHYDASWQGNVMCHHASDAPVTFSVQEFSSCDIDVKQQSNKNNILRRRLLEPKSQSHTNNDSNQTIFA